MKIAVVSRGIPDQKNPMNGIFEFDQAKALASTGNDVVLLIVDLRSIRRFRHWGISTEKRENILCHKISIPVGNVPDYLFCIIGAIALRILYSYAYPSGSRPDIIHSHFTRQSYMAAVLSKKTNVPLVITEHSSDMNKNIIKNSLKKIAKKAYSSAKTIIAVSSSLAKNIKEKTGFDCVIVPNVVNSSLFFPSINKSKDFFQFVSVGRLIERKRMDLLIEAFSEVHKNRPNTKLVIFGSGNMETMLRHLIQSYKIEDCVELRGLVDRNEIAKEFQKSNAFVLLSERETFGVAYIEALAAGLPVIATNCHGPEDFMNDSFGYMIERNNRKQAIDAMIKIYESINSFSPFAISKTIKEMYSPETIARQLVNLYTTII